MAPDNLTQRPETRDIPDVMGQEPPKVVLPPDVQAEREVRRYINKEGVFSKDIEQYFAVYKGINSDGKMVYEQTKTRTEAEQIVRELCEKTGRKVAADSMTGRLKATPGWNLNIRVPGMAQSEQKAAAESDAHLQARANQQQILDLRKQNEELAAQLKALKERMPAETEKPKDEGRETKDEPRKVNREELEGMTVPVLRDLAENWGVELINCKSKSEILDALMAATQNKS